ncbi:MAG: GSCFA domain protein, partial [Bacteroidales bacterium]
ADDMLHPSSAAIEYIWEHFSETYFDSETKQINAEINKILQAKNHRPLKPETENHRKFLKNQIQLIEKTSQSYPFIDLTEELKFFKSSM